MPDLRCAEERGMTNRNKPFRRHPVDGTNKFAVPLTTAYEIHLKAMNGSVIALSLVSPVNRTTGEETRQ